MSFLSSENPPWIQSDKISVSINTCRMGVSSLEKKSYRKELKCFYQHFHLVTLKLPMLDNTVSVANNTVPCIKKFVEGRSYIKCSCCNKYVGK